MGNESNLILKNSKENKAMSLRKGNKHYVSVSSSEEIHGVGGAFVRIPNLPFASQMRVNTVCTLPSYVSPLWLRTGKRSTLHYSCHDYSTSGIVPNSCLVQRDLQMTRVLFVSELSQN